MAGGGSHFHYVATRARAMTDGALAVTAEKCYGCALCLDVCPDDCIEMVER